MNDDPKYKSEPSYNLLDALKLVPLFYSIGWTPEKKAEWLRITGSSEATTKVMCEHILSAIAVLESHSPASIPEVLPPGAIAASHYQCGTAKEREAFIRGVLWATEIGSAGAPSRAVQHRRKRS